MRVQEIMTVAVECCTPGDTAQRAAAFMREANSGVVPVIASKNDPTVIGIVTDRDLCMDIVAAGRDPNQTHVQECMTRRVISCRPEDDVEGIADLMAENQIRRMPVVNDGGALVGIVSLADIAQSPAGASEIADTLHDISEPTTQPSVPRAEDKAR